MTSTRGSDYGASRGGGSRGDVRKVTGNASLGSMRMQTGGSQMGVGSMGKGGFGDYKWTDQFSTNPTFSSNPWAAVANGLEAEYFELKKVSDFFEYGKKGVPTNNYGGAILSCGITKGRLKTSFKVKSVSGGLLVGACRLDMPVGVHWLEHQNCAGMVWLYQCPGGGFWNGPKPVVAADFPQSAEGRKRAQSQPGGSSREVGKHAGSSTSVLSSDSKMAATVSPQGSQLSVLSESVAGVSPQGSFDSMGKARGGGKDRGGGKGGLSPQNSKDSTGTAGSKKQPSGGNGAGRGGRASPDGSAAGSEAGKGGGGESQQQEQQPPHEEEEELPPEVLRVKKGLLSAGDVLEVDLDMDLGEMQVSVNGVAHPEKCYGVSKMQKLCPCVFMYGKGTHVEVTSCQTGRYADLSRQLPDEDEEVGMADGQESAFWHPRRSLFMEVHEQKPDLGGTGHMHVTGQMGNDGESRMGRRTSSSHADSSRRGSTAHSGGAHGLTAPARPKSSTVTRVGGGLQGENGPCCAMLLFSACAEWTGPHCCGQLLTCEFVINERLGSMEFGVVTAKAPITATWCSQALTGQAFWYSWSGAMREGSTVQGLRKPSFGKGDTIKVQVDLYNGQVAFYKNNHEAGRMTVRAVQEAREKAAEVAQTRQRILALLEEIEQTRHQVLLGKFRLRWVLKDKKKELARKQVVLREAAAALRAMKGTARVELFPAVSISRPGDSVTVSGRVLDMAKPAKPLSETPICGVPSDVEELTRDQEEEEDEEEDWGAIVPGALQQRRSPLLELLTDQEMDALEEGYIRKLSKGERLRGMGGEEAMATYVLLKGAISVFNLSRKEEVLVLKTPGDVFGELTVMNSKPWPAEAKAKEDACLLEIGPDILSGIFHKRRPLVAHFMGMTKDRVQGNALKGEAWRSFFLLSEVPKYD